MLWFISLCMHNCHLNLMVYISSKNTKIYICMYFHYDLKDQLWIMKYIRFFSIMLIKLFYCFMKLNEFLFNLLYRESILKTAKALVEDTKLLVSGAASNQEQLAMAAQNSVLTITRLADAVKRGAESLGSEQPEAQVFKAEVLIHQQLWSISKEKSKKA